jgi:hypothetical protein
VVLTEDETHWVAASVAAESEISGTAQGIYDKLNAALDRDPAVLEERVAQTLWNIGRVQAGPVPLINKWDETRAETAKASTRQLARAVLAALTEQEARTDG